MALNAEEVFTETVRVLPLSERLSLAALILQELAQPEVVVVDRSDTWSDQDQADLTAVSLRHAAELYPERVKLFFLRLPSAEYAIHRIKQRVLEGGHFVPDEVVRRRFKVGLEHFENLYKPIVDEWVVYDNSGLTPVLLEKGGKNE